MSWLEPSASQQEEDLSVWELPADGQHLEGARASPSEKFEKTCHKLFGSKGCISVGRYKKKNQITFSRAIRTNKLNADAY